VPAIPHALDPSGEMSRETLELALPLLEEAAGAPVTGMTGDDDPMLAVERALVHDHYDEVIVSTLPERISHWLKRDLPGRIERLGIPVTLVKADQARWPVNMPVHFGGP
jgi:hypothetical protein